MYIKNPFELCFPFRKVLINYAPNNRFFSVPGIRSWRFRSLFGNVLLFLLATIIVLYYYCNILIVVFLLLFLVLFVLIVVVIVVILVSVVASAAIILVLEAAYCINIVTPGKIIYSH